MARFFFLLGSGLIASLSSSAKDFHVFYLGGQSNMDGYGFVKDLPESMKEPMEEVWIYHGNPAKDGTAADGRGLWSKLRPGHGRSFGSDGQINRYSDRFGPEMTLASELKKAFPEKNLAFIKYSRGGTSIDSAATAAKKFGCWDPEWTGGEAAGKGINQFDHFLATLEKARGDTDVDDDGEVDRLIPAGILWMQGESDAQQLAVAEEYGKNLAGLMGEIRKALSTDQVKPEDIPVVIGRITDWKVWTHGDVVRAAQAKFAKDDPKAELVTSTDGYGNSDRWHYDSAGYMDLGSEFAKALISLLESD